MKKKAVVLEKTGSVCTVLDSDGVFRRVKARAEVGEEIAIAAWNWQGARRWLSAAAVLLLAVTLAFGWNLYQAPRVVAWASVDINPSLQLGLDAAARVVEVLPVNGDAERLLRGMSVKGQPLPQALGSIVERAVADGLLNDQHNLVVVGVAGVTAGAGTAALPAAQALAAKTQAAAGGHGVVPQVVVFALEPAEYRAAQQDGLTLGEYGLWRSARAAGLAVQPQAVKDTDERKRLLEQPRVKEEISKAKGVAALPAAPAVRPGSPEKSAVPVVPEQPQLTSPGRQDGDQRGSKEGDRQEHKSQGWSPEKDAKRQNSQDHTGPAFGDLSKSLGGPGKTSPGQDKTGGESRSLERSREVPAMSTGKLDAPGEQHD